MNGEKKNVYDDSEMINVSSVKCKIIILKKMISFEYESSFLWENNFTKQWISLMNMLNATAEDNCWVWLVSVCSNEIDEWMISSEIGLRIPITHIKFCGKVW